MLADGFDVTVVGGVARVAGEIDGVSAPAFDQTLTALSTNWSSTARR